MQDEWKSYGFGTTGLRAIDDRTLWRVSSPKNENVPVFYSPSKHPRCLWLSSFRRIKSELYKNIVLAPPILTMGQVGVFCQQFRRHELKCCICNKTCLTWLRGVNKGLLLQIHAFLWDKYPNFKRNKHLFLTSADGSSPGGWRRT